MTPGKQDFRRYLSISAFGMYTFGHCFPQSLYPFVNLSAAQSVQPDLRPLPAFFAFGQEIDLGKEKKFRRNLPKGSGTMIRY